MSPIRMNNNTSPTGLSALDFCIYGQVAMLDALQMHKQGLLQQFFPLLEGR